MKSPTNAVRPAAPRVSVVLPTYNRAYCLPEAIEAILAQSLTDWELIVVDDGSTDDTPALMRRYCAQDSRIRYVRQPHMGGPARALNLGLRLARGGYLYKQDDDDLAEADLIAKCVAGLDASPNHWAIIPKRKVYGGSFEKGWTFSASAFGGALFFRVQGLRLLKGWNEFFAFLEDRNLMNASYQRGWQTLQLEEPLYIYRVIADGNSTARAAPTDIFGYAFLLRQVDQLRQWQLRYHVPIDWSLRRALGAVFSARPTLAILPCARFAFWQSQMRWERVLSHPQLWQTERRWQMGMDGLHFARALLQERPRFPYAALLKAQAQMWQRLRLLHAPLRSRLKAAWLLTRDYYFHARRKARLRAQWGV